MLSASSRAPTVVIDDVDDALNMLSPLGRKVLSDPIRLISQAVLLIAGEHRWQVVTHGAFVRWWRSQREEDEALVIMDPLAPANPKRQSWRLQQSRQEGVGGIDFGSSEIVGLPARTKSASIVDDTAASGESLLRAASRLADRGIAVRRFMLCCTTAEARAVIKKEFPRARLETYMKGSSFFVMHLRDGCPHLPYSGRPDGLQSVLTLGDTRIAVRTPSFLFAGGVWERVKEDVAVMALIRRTYGRIEDRFKDLLGRTPTVADLPLLGREVVVPRPRDVIPHPAMTLRDLFLTL